MSVRSTIAGKLIPDVHRVAPNANRGLVQQAEIRAIKGVGPLPPAAAAADKHLKDCGGDVDKAIHDVIETHVRLSAAQGFVTNLGGLVTMAATVPANISGLALLQCRMIAGIAHLSGYDLDDPRVRNAILLTMLGEDHVNALVKKRKIPGSPMVIATAPTHDPSLDPVIAGEVDLGPDEPGRGQACGQDRRAQDPDRRRVLRRRFRRLHHLAGRSVRHPGAPRPRAVT